MSTDLKKDHVHQIDNINKGIALTGGGTRDDFNQQICTYVIVVMVFYVGLNVK